MPKKLFRSLLGCFLLLMSLSQPSFACWPSPKVLTLSQNSGVNNGKVELSITGEKFSKNVLIKLAKTGQPDIVAENVTVVSKTQITCAFDLNGKAVGAWDVIIINKNKFLFFNIDKPTKLANGYTIESPGPTVASIEPKEAANDGVVRITGLQGEGFRPGASVTLTNQQLDVGAIQVKVDSESVIECVLDLTNIAPGVYDVKVTNDDGKSGLLPGGFRIMDSNSILSLKNVSPNKGFNNGSLLINIQGACFGPDTIVKLTGPAICPGTMLKFQSTSNINCFVELTNLPVGSYDVVASNPGGQTATLPGGFIVEAFDPNSNPNQQLKPIFFDFDKFNLRFDQIVRLDRDLAILKANPNLYISLGGHADERGTREYNLQLSAKRAEAIKQYLVERGVNPKQITIYSYGKDYPLQNSHSESFWWYNRRVDIMVWEQQPTKTQDLQNVKIDEAELKNYTGK